MCIPALCPTNNRVYQTARRRDSLTGSFILIFTTEEFITNFHLSKL